MVEVEAESGQLGVGGGDSQALLGQGGGDLVGQRGQLRRVGHVDAARGRHGAELMGGVFQRDDLGAVVGAGLGRLAEGQFVALNLLAGSKEIILQHPLLGNFIYKKYKFSSILFTNKDGSSKIIQIFT